MVKLSTVLDLSPHFIYLLTEGRLFLKDNQRSKEREAVRVWSTEMFDKIFPPIGCSQRVSDGGEYQWTEELEAQADAEDKKNAFL